MRSRHALHDTRAVSPVIGVILMVAITVILAAVIGTFVLDIGQDPRSTPQASFDFEYNSSSQNLTITHAGGDTFTNENSNDLTITGGNSTTQFGTFPGVSAGDSTDYQVQDGDTVRIVWTAPGGGETQTVARFEVPA